MSASKFLFFTILTFLLSTNFIFSQTAEDTLSQQLTQLCQSTKVPGFAVAVVRKDKVLYQNEFGYADIASQKPYQTSTIQNVGSTSKTFVGVAIMKAVEQGKLTLDTPISDILPIQVIHPKHPNISITVKHLATHTSGIVDSKLFWKNDYVVTNLTDQHKKNFNLLQRFLISKMKNNSKVSLADFLPDYLSPKGKFYSTKNFGDAPGMTYEYSNAGAGLAAWVVEVAVGQPFEVYTQKHIFDPIGMTATGWFFKDVDMEQHATLYFPKNVAPVPTYTLNTYPDGGLLTNVENLSRYLQEMMRGFAGESKLLSAESFQTMMTDYVSEVSNADEKLGYGIFWDVAKSGARGHSGSDPGANSLMYFFPEQDIGILFIVNMSLDDNKKTVPIYQQLWKLLRGYSKEVNRTEK